MRSTATILLGVCAIGLAAMIGHSLTANAADGGSADGGSADGGVVGGGDGGAVAAGDGGTHSNNAPDMYTTTSPFPCTITPVAACSVWPAQLSILGEGEADTLAVVSSGTTINSAILSEGGVDRQATSWLEIVANGTQRQAHVVFGERATTYDLDVATGVGRLRAWFRGDRILDVPLACH